MALGYLRLLYGVEAEAVKMTPESRLALRQEKAAPVLREFKTWLKAESYKILPQSPIGEAFHYTLAQ